VILQFVGSNSQDIGFDRIEVVLEIGHVFSIQFIDGIGPWRNPV